MRSQRARTQTHTYTQKGQGMLAMLALITQQKSTPRALAFAGRHNAHTRNAYNCQTATMLAADDLRAGGWGGCACGDRRFGVRGGDNGLDDFDAWTHRSTLTAPSPRPAPGPARRRRPSTMTTTRWTGEHTRARKRAPAGLLMCPRVCVFVSTHESIQWHKIACFL